MNTYLLITSIVIFLCILLNRVSNRIGIPALLAFIVLGMLFGTDGIMKIDFDNYAFAEQICSTALIFIMFYGGFGTNWQHAKAVAVKSVLLSTIGVIITCFLTGLFCHFALHMSWEISFLLGALISSTDAASVFSILRSKKLNLKYNTASLLEVESGSNDPCAYMLTVAFIAVSQGSASPRNIAILIVKQLAFGIIFGVLIAKLSIMLLRYIRFKSAGFDAIFMVGIALISYALPAYFDGNGFLSAYIVGIILGNTEIENNKEDYIENELEFVTNHFDMKENSFLSGLEKAQAKNKLPFEANLQENEDEQQVEQAEAKLELKKDEAQENKSEIENESNLDSETENEEEPEAPKESLITREEKRKINYKYIGIAFKTYIIVEIENEIYLIDQHAAHERVLYEQIKENYKNHIQNNVQMMLIPEVFTLSYKEARFVKENMELFKNTGFDIEFFGDNTIKISGIPDLEYKVDRSHVFLDVLDEMLTNERSSLKDIEERFVATVACKAAVKAGMDLSRQEVENLISSLLELKNPYTCPHGRPTTIKIDIH